MYGKFCTSLHVRTTSLVHFSTHLSWSHLLRRDTSSNNFTPYLFLWLGIIVLYHWRLFSYGPIRPAFILVLFHLFVVKYYSASRWLHNIVQFYPSIRQASPMTVILVLTSNLYLLCSILSTCVYSLKTVPPLGCIALSVILLFALLMWKKILLKLVKIHMFKIINNFSIFGD